LGCRTNNRIGHWFVRRGVSHVHSGEARTIRTDVFVPSFVRDAAVIVSNIESLQQTLNITLTQTYTHLPISVEALVWMRSCSIVLLIIGHAVKHADGHEDSDTTTPDVDEDFSTEQVDPERANERADEQVVVTEDVCEQPKIEQPEVVPALPAPKQRRTDNSDILQRVQAYLLEHPNATTRKAQALFLQRLVQQ
jgi:hypothetical protein